MSIRERPHSRIRLKGGNQATLQVRQTDEIWTDLTVPPTQTYGLYGQGVFNVRDYGAIGDDSTDDTIAVAAAFAAAIADGGGTVAIPSGTYRLTSDLGITMAGEQHLHVVGEGKYQSFLNFTGSCTTGLLFVSTTPTAFAHPTFHVADLSLTASVDALDAGIEFRWFDDLALEETWYVRNVRIAYSGGYFTDGIKVTDGRNGEISNCLINSPNVDIGAGIHILEESTALDIWGCEVYGFDTGLLVEGTTEGVYCFANDFLFGNYGVRMALPGTEPQYAIIGNSANTRMGGFWVTGTTDAVIQGNTVFQMSTQLHGSYDDWIGIKVDGATNYGATISGNTLHRWPNADGVSTIGIQIAAGAAAHVLDNHLVAAGGFPMGAGVDIVSGATGTRVRNNHAEPGTIIVDVANAGTGTQILTWADGEYVLSGAANQIFQIKGTTAAFLRMYDTGGVSNEKLYDVVGDAGELAFKLLNDDTSVKYTPLTLRADGRISIPEGIDASTELILSGSANQIFQIKGTVAAFLRMYDTGSGANLKLSDIVQDAGELQFRLLNDDLSLKSIPLTLQADGIARMEAAAVAANGDVGLLVDSLDGGAAFVNLNQDALGWSVYDDGAGLGVYSYTTAGDVARFHNDGGISLKDGITAPATHAGFATLYVDTADGDLKVRFGDGTVKTIVVDT